MRLPTLTDVVQPGFVRPRAGQAADDTAQTLAQRLQSDVLTAVRQRVDITLEARVREALAPVLARAVDQVLREVRDELSRTVREVVAEAVDQELARRRNA